MYNQGKTALSFGESGYLIAFDEPNIVIEAIRNNGGTQEDSKWSLTKRRGNYIGTLIVSDSANFASLRYLEVEE